MITFKNQRPYKGSNAIRINVELDGVPFGQIWTFLGDDETHPMHAKTLNDEYQAFYGHDRLAKAKAFIEACAN